MHGSHWKKSYLAWFLGDVSITQNSKIWVMDDGNWKQNFSFFNFLKYELCDQTIILEFLRQSEVRVMIYGFWIWVWVMSYRYWVMKTESWPNQTSPKQLIFNYTLFHTLFLSYVFQKTTNNITQTLLPNGPLILLVNEEVRSMDILFRVSYLCRICIISMLYWLFYIVVF